MKKLEYTIRGLLWLLWNFAYFCLASWVLQAEPTEISSRLATAMLWVLWNFTGLMTIECFEAPKAIAKSLMEDTTP